MVSPASFLGREAEVSMHHTQQVRVADGRVSALQGLSMTGTLHVWLPHAGGLTD